uniref:Uncharacterized protein n=1 Tax=Lotharella globosa TaxID=91324 RepID=A0A7S4DJG9_9EUKA|mmetsp:Transcript_5470/g.10728  ORF Transcript_5470/g.10728 Transcript_5470/m.10728 type:complete len:115 (-) Transcript_5470:1660-2004(-)
MQGAKASLETRLIEDEISRLSLFTDMAFHLPACSQCCPPCTPVRLNGTTVTLQETTTQNYALKQTADLQTHAPVPTTPSKSFGAAYGFNIMAAVCAFKSTEVNTFVGSSPSGST